MLYSSSPEEAREVVARIRTSYEAFKSKSFSEIEFAKEALQESQAFVNRLLQDKFNSFTTTLHTTR